jgi:hypothetical protein
VELSITPLDSLRFFALGGADHNSRSAPGLMVASITQRSFQADM